ncbi:hypothetical protein NBRC116601_33570 [Cognatishimia sp. WU-CL00825]|uniref:polysaccharide pyruvyl transferase family protein n=1 Tax=Cognatishimia sp. WU-CL00825 TaxID=3127658 RepID=UPI003108EA12
MYDLTLSQAYGFYRRDLIPAAWMSKLSANCMIFNPTLAPVENGYAMCYRIVQPHLNFRGMATCLLDENFNIVPETVTPLSDLIEFAAPEALNERALNWHADPRYQVLQGRIYLSWNDGENRPQNNQFLLEMDSSGLRPAGVARRLRLQGMARRTVEKNWMFFTAQEQTYCVYSISPHVVLAVDFSGSEDIVCRPVANVAWQNEYSTIFGVLRGGAQPLLWQVEGEARFVSVAHSSYKVPGGRKYEACLYEFSSQPPFQVTRCSVQPIELNMNSHEGFEFEKLNSEVMSVVYPCGAQLRGAALEDLAVSYGINDENLAITELDRADLERVLKPVEVLDWGVSITDVPPGSSAPKIPDWPLPANAEIPMFWWDSAGKKFDGDLGERRFKTGNFGDLAAKEIVEAISGYRAARPLAGVPKLISVGSVLHTARDRDVIWGAGLKGTERKLHPSVKSLDVRAVRGPLTLDFLREAGFDVGQVTEVFDPGCLVAYLYKKQIKAFDVAQNQDRGPFRIVPHFRDDLLMRRMHKHVHHAFLPVDSTPLDMVLGMLGAEAVYSSSLHGVIFAESLGIPAYWLKSVGGEDSYKFFDYYYGTGRYNVRCFESLSEAMSGTPMALPKFRPTKYLETFPKDRLCDLAQGISGLLPGDTLAFTHEQSATLKDALVHDKVGRIGSEGFWFHKKNASCGLRLALAKGAQYQLELVVRPFNAAKLPQPQQIKLIVGERHVVDLRWRRGDQSDKIIQVPVSAEMLVHGLLPLRVQATHAVSPLSLGVGQIAEKLTLCLKSMALHRQ